MAILEASGCLFGCRLLYTLTQTTEMENDKMDIGVLAEAFPAHDMGCTSSADSKLELPPDQQAKLTNNLKTASSWQPFIDATPGDESRLSSFEEFLEKLLMKLLFTNFKDLVQGPATGDDLRQRVSKCDADTLQQFKDAVLKGVNENDWEKLVAHRTYHMALEVNLPLTVATAMVRVQLSPSVSGIVHLSKIAHLLIHSSSPSTYSTSATEKSWAAGALWEHIMHHFNPVNSKDYAHFAAIVQSSGMGKSRTVDELSKDHFVIPLNLREPSSTGT